jgi:hypothetical protein
MSTSWRIPVSLDCSEHSSRATTLRGRLQLHPEAEGSEIIFSTRCARLVIGAMVLRQKWLPRRHQPRIVPQCLKLATEMMCPNAGLHADQTRAHIGKPRWPSQRQSPLSFISQGMTIASLRNRGRTTPGRTDGDEGGQESSKAIIVKRPSVAFPEWAGFARRLRIICFIEALSPALEPHFDVGVDFSAVGNGSKIANQVVDLLNLFAQQA